MIPGLKLFRAVFTLVLLLLCLGTASPEATAQKKTAPPRPTAPRAGRVHRYVVQARNPRWQTVTIAANRQAAHVIKLNMQRRGFQVRLRPQSGGRVLVLARMMHWHAVGVYTNQHVAHHIVVMLRQRGMQARVVGGR